jgi:hypothetical protein
MKSSDAQFRCRGSVRINGSIGFGTLNVSLLTGHRIGGRQEPYPKILVKKVSKAEAKIK